jgi:hypothetical protein
MWRLVEASQKYEGLDVQSESRHWFYQLGMRQSSLSNLLHFLGHDLGLIPVHDIFHEVYEFLYHLESIDPLLFAIPTTFLSTLGPLLGNLPAIRVTAWKPRTQFQVSPLQVWVKARTSPYHVPLIVKARATKPGVRRRTTRVSGLALNLSGFNFDGLATAFLSKPFDKKSGEGNFPTEGRKGSN